MSRRPRPRFGMTAWEIAVVVAVIGLILVVLLPGMGGTRRHPPQMKNSSQLRGIHQSMVILAESNNKYLPGLDSHGEALKDGAATGFSGNGSTPAARFWILLNGQFIPGDLMINPIDTRTKWTTGAVTTQNYSYAMLQIGNPVRDDGRIAEWRDLANSQAAMISDRNTGVSVANSQVQSVWTTAPGDWRGNLVWGDNHAEFIQSNRGLTTRYNKMTSTNDNLFLDGPRIFDSPATERGTKPGSNALMVWE